MTDFPKQKLRMTAEGYKTLPESNLHAELISGELIIHEGKDGMSPAPKDEHQATSFILAAFLLQFFPARELRAAPTDVYLVEENVVQPDIFWVSAASGRCARQADGYLHGAPDFVIEILSPATAQLDRGVKFDLYEQCGVLEYWLVDPDARFVEVYRRENDRFARQGLFPEGKTFKSIILNGASVKVADLLP